MLVTAARSGARRPIGLLLWIVSAGCTDPTIQVRPPWAEDREIVVVLTDGLGAFVKLVPELFFGRAPIQIDVEGHDEFQVVAHAYPPGVVKAAEFQRGGPGRPLPDTDLYAATFDGDVETTGFVSTGFGNQFDLRDLDAGPEFLPCEGVTIEVLDLPQLKAVHELVWIPGSGLWATGISEPQVHVLQMVGSTFEDRHQLRKKDDVDHGRGLGWDGTTLWVGTLRGRIAALELDGTVIHSANHSRTIHGIAAADGIAIAWSPHDPSWLLSRTSTAPEILTDVPPGVSAMFILDRSLIYTASVLIHRRDPMGQWVIDEDLGVRNASHIHANDAQAVAWLDVEGGVQKRRGEDWREIASPRDEVANRAYAVGKESILTIGDSHSSSFWNGTKWCAIDPPDPLALFAALITPDQRTAFVSGSGGTPPVGRVYRVSLPIVP